MFPTTVWDVIRDAGERDPEALERVAAAYRGPVLAYVRARGIRGQDAEDLCHEVFVRLLRGGVLAKADADRGSFRSLLRIVTVRTIQDWRRRARPREQPLPEPEPAAPESEFDRAWALHLTERALARLRREHPRQHEVLRRHLEGEGADRHRLYRARQALVRMIRREIALTCRSRSAIDEEARCLAPYLRP